MRCGAFADVLILTARLYMSESDVYRRQILTYKDGPHTGRVNDELHCPRRWLNFKPTRSEYASVWTVWDQCWHKVYHRLQR